MKNKKLMAFTLAEVLITLAIIGVVAALTIPTVITNYQKKMYVTQLKKTYNTLTNGFKTYMANEGVTKLSDTALWTTVEDNITPSTLLEDGNEKAKDEFLKIFKVAGIYNEENFPEGQTLQIKGLNGEEVENVNFGVFLADGAYLYFELKKDSVRAECEGSRECSSLKEFQEKYSTPTKMWEWLGQFVVDVNGAKGPNILGRDVFIFILANDGALYPMGGKDIAVLEGCNYNSMDSCNHYWKQDSYKSCLPNSDGEGCAGRIMEENWEMRY